MGQPKKLESYDPAYMEMFMRVAENGEVFTLPCETHGKAVYLCQRLRSYRKLLVEQSEKRKELLTAASQARMVEVAIEGSRVIVRAVGGTWTSQVVMQALLAGRAAPTRTDEAPTRTDEVPPVEVGPPVPKHGYY
jgi:hypothetical protein